MPKTGFVNFLNFYTLYRRLPQSFYQPGSAEKYSDFIEQWGTHMVKGVVMGGKFSMKTTQQSKKSLTVDDFKSATQSKFEHLTATSTMHNIQTGSSTSKESQASASFVIASASSKF